jgi:hypothetical protein
MILDHPGGPNVITRVLIKGSQKGQHQKRSDNRSRGQSDARKGPWGRKCGWPPKRGTSKEMDLPQLGMEVHAYNPSTQETEAGDSQVQDKPWLHSKTLY